MLTVERQALILRELARRGTVRVDELAERLDVSPITVRRDLQLLADRGQLTRVHGGASLAQPQRTSRPVPARSPTAVLGLVVPSAHFYFPAITRGAQLAAAARQARLILSVTNYNADDERDQIARLLDLGIDGLLVTPCEPLTADNPTLAMLESLPVPVVLVERIQPHHSQRADLDLVRSDHFAGAMLAVEHLRGLGHDRIGLLVTDSPTAPQLIDGMRQSLSDSPEAAGDRVFTTASAAIDRVQAAAAANALVDTCARSGVTGALVHSDQEAALVVRVARRRGIDVPRQLSVVAYDDELAELCEVPLTAVAPPKRDVGVRAVERCLHRIAQRPGNSLGNGPESVERTLLMPTLIQRYSTAPPPTIEDR